MRPRLIFAAFKSTSSKVINTSLQNASLFDKLVNETEPLIQQELIKVAIRATDIVLEIANRILHSFGLHYMRAFASVAGIGLIRM